MDAVLDPTPRAGRRAAEPEPGTGRALAAAATAVAPRPKFRELLIVGLTVESMPFRPSDWSERLAGAMSAFRPAGSVGGIAAFIGYSPYCVPRTVDGHKCVLVNEALRGIEVLAWDFVMNFARDNRLEVRDVTPGTCHGASPA